MSKTMVLKPRVSEKAYAQSQEKNVYVFVVPTDANRTMIADAVAVQFDVTVTDVNVMNVKGKVKRSVRKGGRQTFGKRVDIKKAYVTLQQGDAIPVFAQEQEAEAEAAKADKKGKK